MDKHKTNIQLIQNHAVSKKMLKNRAEAFQFTALLALAVALLIPRLDGLDYFPGKYLWAEDGNIFINEAESLGIPSLWRPYNGYLHIYPRLVSIVANYFHLDMRPTILILGWLIAYLFLFAVLIRRASSLGVGLFSLIFLVILVSLQPHYGENFFNITNSQWMLGSGLSVLVLTSVDESFHISASRFILLLLLGLTGPFSIILIPILVLKAFFAKDVKKNLWIYLTLLVCATVQLSILLNSGRATSGTINAQAWDWVTSFFQILLFGTNNPGEKVAAISFWVLILILMVDKRGEVTQEVSTARILPFFFLLTAILFIIASQYSHKENPMLMTAPGGGNRYTWIPYTLIFFSAILLSKDKRLIRFFLFAFGSMICYKNFHHVSSPNLQFKSFANFAKYENLMIPIHPQWPKFPGWYIDGIASGQYSLEHISQFNIKQDNMSVIGAQSNLSLTELEIESKTNDPILILRDKVICNKASDIALKIDITRSIEGWMQIFWDKDGNFSEPNSLKRYYPAGLVQAQFAFPYNPEGIYIRLDPLDVPGKAKISQVTAYCLP
ncbi:MAG: hypothetical protein ACR65R_20705 [Methylomicrobium sp.]